jgi:protein MAK16
MYYPTFLKHKCKQRLTKLTQYLIRSRRLMLAPGPRVITRMAPKRARREETRERKALAAARLEKQIEKELVNRLKSGNYTEDMLNINEEIWNKVLDQRARAERGEPEEEEAQEEIEEEVEFVSDEEGFVSGDEEFDDWLGDQNEFEESEGEEVEVGGKRKLSVDGDNGKRKVARVEIEYEEEREDESVRQRVLAD